MNTLDHSPNDPLINKLHTVRETLETCPQIWLELAKACPDKRALFDEHLCDETVDLTFAQMENKVRRSAALFQKLGVKKGDNVAIFAENSGNWLVPDHGIQLAGGASAVRGADAPVDELRYIYEHSNSAGIAVLQGPRLLQKLATYAQSNDLVGLGLENSMHGPVKTIILLNREKKTKDDIVEIAATVGSNLDVHFLSDLVDATTPVSYDDVPEMTSSDLSTIVYTSGTTGNPKGVMLTHGNLISQLGHRLGPTRLFDETEPIPGDIMLSLLPVWHITERTFELWMFSRGCNVVYSSIRTFKKDLAKHQPQWMVLVPRVLEKVAFGVQDKFSKGSAVAKTLVKLFSTTSTLSNVHSKKAQNLVVSDSPASKGSRRISKLIVALLAPLNAVGNKLVWSKVKDGFGGRTKAIISGGSALSGSLESFYEMCGIKISVGYGLTECSPLLAFRRTDQNLVTAGCIGKPCANTELRIVDPEVKAGNIERKALPDGEVGVVLGRGPQVMKGYYKNAEATSNAIDNFGWFDTGDLGKINPATGDVILTGRCKDTIVLSNGENIEPSPIEDAILLGSSMIEQVMLAGQDGRSLVAILVLNPNLLVNAGFLNQEEGKALQKQYEKINDPSCQEDESASYLQALNDASKKLRDNEGLEKSLITEIRQATSNFRPWEQVGGIYITLEPFAMVNGLLTQSYKVKRDVVYKRYSDEL
uniref:AMP-dependent synthetase/ligase domain-containing protein n=1 Tax=Eucampia antarctica TaxID=49252 RepID=A0A7S2SD18_9STRA